MGGSLTLGHVRGIPIRAHFTLLFVVPYFAFLMAARFPEVAAQAGVVPETVRLPPVVWGLVLVFGLFACVLAHELGHALVAMRAGGRVSGITLMLLGGVSELYGMPRSPRVEALVAVAGPVVSLVIGLIGLWAHTLGFLPPDARFGLFYLGQINLVLAVFNLLPAFPMDGGRVLRALLALRLDRTLATRIASVTGMIFAGLFVLVGFLGANLILALIGLFIWTGAQAERMAVEREEAWAGLTVRDVMSPACVLVEGWRSASEAAELLSRARATALPVTDAGRVAGVVAVHHLTALDADERASTPVRALLDSDVPHLQAGESLLGALEQMAERQVSEAPVMDGLEVVGVLEPNDLGRMVKLRQLARGGRGVLAPKHRPIPLQTPARPTLHRDQT